MFQCFFNIYFNYEIILFQYLLESRLKEKLSVDYDEMILGMMMMLLEYDVYCFYEVLDGMGLLDLVFVGIFCIWDVKVIFFIIQVDYF